MPRRTQRQIPGQLPMFMTPREINTQYQVLDADRGEYGVDQGSWSADTGNNARVWERTSRPAQTGGFPNIHDPGATLAGGGRKRRYEWAEGTGDYVREPRPETDEEVHARKLAESAMDPEDYRYAHEPVQGHGSAGRSFDPERALERRSAPQPPSYSAGTSTWEEHEGREHSYLERKATEHAEARWNEPSMWESIRQEGVRSPVHLGSQFGSQGKPQIVGGHHRIAAAMDIAPDRLIPVLHHSDTKSAQRRDSGYKYD